MKKQTLFDEYIMGCIAGFMQTQCNPLQQQLATSSNTIQITHNHMFDYYNLKGKSFDVSVNGGYKDGKAKIQTRRN